MRAAGGCSACAEPRAIHHPALPVRSKPAPRCPDSPQSATRIVPAAPPPCPALFLSRPIRVAAKASTETASVGMSAVCQGSIRELAGREHQAGRDQRARGRRARCGRSQIPREAQAARSTRWSRAPRRPFPLPSPSTRAAPQCRRKAAPPTTPASIATSAFRVPRLIVPSACASPRNNSRLGRLPAVCDDKPRPIRRISEAVRLRLPVFPPA